MLVFAAFVPHPPLLIPTIGKESLGRLKNTFQAMLKLEQELYQSKIETLMVISPHGNLIDDAFTMNLSTSYKLDFEQFGDLATSMTFKPDVALIHQIKEQVETQLPVQIISDEKLDHGVGVPLYCLTQNLSEFSIVPMGYSSLDPETHFRFGQFIRRLIEPQNKRVGVIASGDLSHALSDDAPAGFSAHGKEFDSKIIELLKKREPDKIVEMNSELVDSASECGYRSLLIMLGMLDSSNWQTEVLSYESPFGIGYLVCNLELNR